MRSDRRTIAQRFRLTVGAVGLIALMGLAPSSSGQTPPSLEAVAPVAPHVDAMGPPVRLTDPSLQAHRPCFSPDGRQLVFSAGAEGAGDLYTVGIDGTGLSRLTDGPADERDPSFTPDGARIVYSSNEAGSYDLYVMGADGTGATRLTDLEGDELEPVVGPLRFTFAAVGPGICGSEVERYEIESYEKVVFTRRIDDRSEVWFDAVGSRTPGVHRGRLSPEGRQCRGPAWSGNGLSLTYVCEGEAGVPIVQDTSARYDHTVREALAALELDRETVSGCGWEDLEGELEETWSNSDCFGSLPRSYTRFVGEPRSDVEAALDWPAYSANQTLLVASRAGTDANTALYARSRTTEGDWQRFDLAPAAPREVTWSPDGARVAFASDHEGSSAVYVAETDFYLQDVVDLIDYPELTGIGRSDRLQANRFVARPGEQREFFALYDQLNYARRGPFVTADAVLQAFHDEFARLLRDAEGDAQERLLGLSSALFDAYAARVVAGGSDRDRYLAVVFGVPTVLLRAAFEVVEADDFAVDPWQRTECDEMRSLLDELSPEDREYFDDECAPLYGGRPSIADQMAEAIPELLAEVPESVRAEIGAHIEAISAHDRLGEVQVPGAAAPTPIDYTQFQVRGHYVDSEQEGYFLALMWYGQVPLPLDESAFDLLDLMEQVPGGGPQVGDEPESPLQKWRAVDQLIGAFMGRPVDVTVSHLLELRRESPELLSPFDRDAVMARLEVLRGPVPLRGLAGALGGGDYGLQFTLFPRRYGQDVAFFSRLTHPDVEFRGMPSALDVFAALGVERAVERATEAEAGEAYFDAYRAALEQLAGETAALPQTFWSTDIYHSWLAMLVALARPVDLPEETVLAFARSEAWENRELSSALAGYAQLKHDAVLYSFQEYGVECGDEPTYLAFTEEPVIPSPRGFVDPEPAFFRAMADLADRVYAELADGDAPDVYMWLPGGEEIQNTRDLALRLADVAEREVRGELIEDADAAWLLQIGPILEALLLSREPSDPEDAYYGEDEGRMDHGVALVADIYSNVMRNEVVELGVGRILDLYVAVPNELGQRMTQGGLFSFYEFHHPIENRLTDEAWNAMLESGGAPAMPSWTRSFVEPRSE